MLQEFNRKAVVGGQALVDQSMNTQLASQQFLSNVEFNNATAEQTECGINELKEQQQTVVGGVVEHHATAARMHNMKVDFYQMDQSADQS